MNSADDQELFNLDEAAQEAYERAAADGLCQIGALEIAREASRTAKTETQDDSINTSA